MEIEGASTVSDYIPDTYIGRGEHKARKHFRDIGRILEEKPPQHGAKVRRAKQAGGKQKNVTDRANFTKIYNKLNTGQGANKADMEYDRLRIILPSMTHLNMLILVIARKYMAILPAQSVDDWNSGNTALIQEYRNLYPAIFQDAVTSGKLSRKPPATVEGVVRDVLRYIKMILAHEEENRRLEYEADQLEFEQYSDELPSAEDDRRSFDSIDSEDENASDRRSGLTRSQREGLWEDDSLDIPDEEEAGRDSEE